MSLKSFALFTALTLNTLVGCNVSDNEHDEITEFPYFADIELSKPTSIELDGIYDVNFLCRSGDRDGLLYIDRRISGEVSLTFNLKLNLEETINYSDGSSLTIDTRETIMKSTSNSTEDSLNNDLSVFLLEHRDYFCDNSFYELGWVWANLNSGKPCPDSAFTETDSCYYKIPN